MANVGTLSIKFTGDARQLERTFTKIGVKANLAASVIEKGFSIASGAAKSFVTQALGVAQENENTITSFKNLTGSISQAKDLYKDLTDFASKTPFARKQITEGATTLLGFGLSARDATQAIKELGAAAAANADTDLKRLVVSYGQIQGANVAMTRDLREFVNNGIPIYQLLADTLDVPVAKLNEMASEGKITGDIIARVFSEAATEGGRFADTLIDQSNTFSGLVSTMKDNYAITLGQIGETLLPAAKEAAKGLNAALLDLQTYFGSNDGQEWAVTLAAAVKGAFDSIGDTIQLEIENWKKNVLEFQVFFQKLKVGATDNFLFSDEIRNQNKKDLKDLEFDLTIAGQRVSNLEKFGKGFGDAFEQAKIDVKAAMDELARAADIADDIAGTGGGLGDPAVTKEILNAWEAVKLYGDGLATVAAIEQGSTISAEKFKAETYNPATDGIGPLGATGAGQGEIDPEVLALERHKAAVEALGEAQRIAGQAAQTFGQALASAQEQGATGARALAIAVVESSKQIIGALIREGVVAAVTNALKGPAGKVPVLGIALAAVAGGAAQALFNGLISSIKIPAFGDGGVVFGPTLALIGEKGPEAIVPLGKGNAGGRSSVVIRGVQYGQDTYWQNANSGISGRLIYGPQ